MAEKTQVVVGGPGSTEWLRDVVKKDLAISWSCGKCTKGNEFIFIYAMKPDCAIVATATASSGAKPDKKWHYVADLKNVKLLERPITRTEMLTEIPSWGWPRQPRRATYPEKAVIKKLAKLARRRGKHTSDSTVSISSAGAGFGTAEENRKVEQAACKAVKSFFEKRGFELFSREKEKIGYDFDVRRKAEELHVEVKGISGSGLRFPISANEVARARSDSKFQIAVVTETNSRRKRVKVFSRKVFLEHFDLKPLAFFAEAKSSLFA